MTKKEPTVENITKELKKFLRERWCLRVFKEVIRVELFKYSLKSFVKNEIRYSKIFSHFHISRLTYIVTTYRWFFVKLHNTLFDWHDHYHKTFTNDN